MKNQVAYIDDNTIIVRGRRVPIAGYRLDKNRRRDGLEPSYGFKRRVMTPWGAQEVCNITPVPSLSGGLEYCAQVYMPKSNPYVKFCTFWVDM